MPEQGTVLLVESHERERERLGKVLEDAGYQVIVCPGPTAPDYRCIGGREGYCPLLEQADVVVLDPWLPGDELGVGTSSDELVALYAGRGRTIFVLGYSGGWQNPYAAGHVVYLDERPDEGTIVAAVRGAPEADGFVFRRPEDGSD
jgi:CheY-like chemotaxis protein